MFYCSAAHQKSDWNAHVDNCVPYTITRKDGVAKLRLRKEIKKGTILLEEAPFFHVPEANGPAVYAFCIVCGLQMTTPNTCANCSWPVCGYECEWVCYSQRRLFLHKLKTKF